MNKFRAQSHLVMPWLSRVSWHRRITSFPIRFVLFTGVTDNGRTMSQTEQKSKVRDLEIFGSGPVPSRERTPYVICLSQSELC